MNPIFGNLLLICMGCGSLERVSESGTTNKAPCMISLGYDSTSSISGLKKPLFISKGYSESCQAYLGANLQTLRYRLNIDAHESVGRMDEIVIDGRHISLANFSLIKQNFVLDDIDISSIDNGPLQMEDIWLTFAFPKGSEIGLYPSKVELMITAKN